MKRPGARSSASDLGPFWAVAAPWILAGCLAVPTPTDVPLPTATANPAASAAVTGTLLVRLRVTAAPGAPAQGGGARPDVDLGPTPGVVVNARTPAGAEYAPGQTDAAGELSFALPPGDYWVYAPAGQPLPDTLAAALTGSRLPSGERVLVWTPVTVVAGSDATVSLVIRLARP